MKEEEGGGDGLHTWRSAHGSLLYPFSTGLHQGWAPHHNYGLGLGFGNQTMIVLVANSLGLELKFEGY